MNIDNETAGRLLNVSGSFFRRLALSLGFRPMTRRVSNGPRKLWGLRHCLAAVLVPTVEKLGCDQNSAVALAHRIGTGFTSDEQAEAAIKGGRCWVMIAAGRAAPELFFLPNLLEAEKELAPGLQRIGATVQKVSIAALWEQLDAAARSLASEQDEAAK